jgi:hypothetical protein
MSTNPFAGYPVEGDPEGELIVINSDDELEFCDDGDFPTAPSVKMEENVHPNVNNGMVYVPPHLVTKTLRLTHSPTRPCSSALVHRCKVRRA